MATMETILATTVGVRAAAAAMTPGTGQSFTLRSQDTSRMLKLMNVSAMFAVLSNLSIRSARMHDNVRGIAFTLAVTAWADYLTNINQDLIQQDNINVIAGIGGGAATNDCAAMAVWCEDIAGAPGNLFTWDFIKPYIKNIMMQEVTLAAAVAGNWDAGARLNVSQDLMKANTKYALLGCLAGQGSGLFSIAGPSTGNVKLGIVADTAKTITVKPLPS